MKEGQPNHIHPDRPMSSFDQIQKGNLDKLYRRMQAPTEVLTAEAFDPEELNQLQERGASFPLEVRRAPEKKFIKGVKERIIFQQ